MDWLRQGAAIVLEGLDILDPAINAFTTRVDAALPWLQSAEYQLVLIHLDQVDYAGHHEGGPQDPRWNQAAQRADDLLAEILAAVDLEQDTLLVVSDHGQIDPGGHGGHPRYFHHRHGPRIAGDRLHPDGAVVRRPRCRRRVGAAERLGGSGQQGAAGQPDIQGIDEGFSQYLRLYWEAQELPTDEAVIGWGDVGLPELNTQLWATNNGFITTMYSRISFQVTSKIDSRTILGEQGAEQLLGLLEEGGRELDLDDVGAELRGDLRGIGADVDRSLAFAR